MDELLDVKRREDEAIRLYGQFHRELEKSRRNNLKEGVLMFAFGWVVGVVTVLWVMS